MCLRGAGIMCYVKSEQCRQPDPLNALHVSERLLCDDANDAAQVADGRHGNLESIGRVVARRWRSTVPVKDAWS